MFLITLLNCGTCYDADNKGELIAELYKQINGEAYIFAGAGSTMMSKSGYDPLSEKRPKGWKNPFSIAKDAAEGGGTAYNVGCLLSYLESLKEKLRTGCLDGPEIGPGNPLSTNRCPFS
ncbi:MAG: hypothetical protein ACRERU_17180 [Methylococcales bacterium]